METEPSIAAVFAYREPAAAPYAHRLQGVEA